MESGKPVGVICHGPWVMIEADVVRGRRMTSWPSVRTDLRNAGADVVDEEVVVDQGLVSSRKPEDLPATLALLRGEDPPEDDDIYYPEDPPVVGEYYDDEA